MTQDAGTGSTEQCSSLRIETNLSKLSEPIWSAATAGAA
jgi:hypothetical protein